MPSKTHEMDRLSYVPRYPVHNTRTTEGEAMTSTAALSLPTAYERFDAPERPESGPVFRNGWLQLSESFQGFAKTANALLTAIAPQLAALRNSWLIDVMRLYNARNEVWLPQSPIVLRFEDTDVVIRTDDEAGMSVWFGAVETSRLVDDGVYLLQWERAWPFRHTSGIAVRGAEIIAPFEADGQPGFRLALDGSELTVFGFEGLTAVQASPPIDVAAGYAVVLEVDTWDMPQPTQRDFPQAALQASAQAIRASGW